MFFLLLESASQLEEDFALVARLVEGEGLFEQLDGFVAFSQGKLYVAQSIKDSRVKALLLSLDIVSFLEVGQGATVPSLLEQHTAQLEASSGINWVGELCHPGPCKVLELSSLGQPYRGVGQNKHSQKDPKPERIKKPVEDPKENIEPASASGLVLLLVAKLALPFACVVCVLALGWFGLGRGRCRRNRSLTLRNWGCLSLYRCCEERTCDQAGAEQKSCKPDAMFTLLRMMSWWVARGFHALRCHAFSLCGLRCPVASWRSQQFLGSVLKK